MNQNQIKTTVEKVLRQSKSMMKTLDDLDKEIHQTPEKPEKDTILDWARKAAGAGNYLLKNYKKARAMKINEEMSSYHSQKVTAAAQNEKFVSAVTDREASYHVRDLRTLRDILESYVESAKNIISICRMHNFDDTAREIKTNL